MAPVFSCAAPALRIKQDAQRHFNTDHIFFKKPGCVVRAEYVLQSNTDIDCLSADKIVAKGRQPLEIR
jgi:hypothetical protein